MAAEQKWIESIEKLLGEAKREDARLKAGVKCAATKLRGHLKEVTDLCKEGRREALEHRKAIPKAATKAKAVPKKEEVPEPVAVPSSEPVKAAKQEPSGRVSDVSESKMPWKETEPKPIVSRRPKKPAPEQK